jgi:hypothetical protein
MTIETFSMLKNSAITGGYLSADGGNQRFFGCEFDGVRVVASGYGVFVNCKFYGCEISVINGIPLHNCIVYFKRNAHTATEMPNV